MWSMMPTGAPTRSFSASRPSLAMRTSSIASPLASRRARSIETSSAADDDTPEPAGTSESIQASKPVNVKPARARTNVTPCT